MATKYLLDTHALVWYLEGNKLLGSAARSIIESTESELILLVIALAEAAFIVEKGRTAIPSVQDLMNDVQNNSRDRPTRS